MNILLKIFKSIMNEYEYIYEYVDANQKAMLKCNTLATLYRQFFEPPALARAQFIVQMSNKNKAASETVRRNYPISKSLSLSHVRAQHTHLRVARSEV